MLRLHLIAFLVIVPLASAEMNSSEIDVGPSTSAAPPASSTASIPVTTHPTAATLPYTVHNAATSSTPSTTATTTSTHPPATLPKLLHRKEKPISRYVDLCASVKNWRNYSKAESDNEQTVVLVQTETHSQHFYEVKCMPDVEGRPCQFLDERIKSRCETVIHRVQALVWHGNEHKYTTILVPSQCSCKYDLATVTDNTSDHHIRHHKHTSRRSQPRNMDPMFDLNEYG